MSQLEAIKKLDAYRVVEHKMIEEMQSEGIVLEHKKTKARLFLVSNDDENKVFCIGFRTPPSDSVKGSVRGAGKGLLKYVLKCHDLSG